MTRKWQWRLALLGASILLAGTAMAARRQAAIWRAAGGPERIAPDLCDGGGRAAWVFVRAGCRHCASHLGALERAAAALPDSARARILSRVHVFGAAAGAPHGVVARADSLRRRLDVRISPTTWLVAADGRVDQAWRGARGRAAWDSALAYVAAGGVP